MKTHGLRYTRIYRIWCNMKRRCYNKNDKSYKAYGGRGITVCDEWKFDFLSFYNWAIESGYNDKLTIDRINVNGNYEPCNCRWLDSKSQCNNKSNNHFITFNGETHTMKQWAEKMGISYQTLAQRINKYKWSIERAITTEAVK